MFFSFCVKHYKYIVFIGTNIAKIVQFRRVAEQAGRKVHSKVQRFVRAFERDAEVSLCVIMLNIISEFSGGVKRLECDVIGDFVIDIRSHAVLPIRLAKRIGGRRPIGGRRGDEWCPSATRRLLRNERRPPSHISGPERWSREDKPETI